MTLASVLYTAPRAPASLPDWVHNDPYWWAALHILCSPTLAGDARVWSHVDLAARRIDCYAMLDEDGWTAAERTMVAAACELHHGDTGDHPAPTLAGVYAALDETNFRRVVEAMCLRRESPIPPALRDAR